MLLQERAQARPPPAAFVDSFSWSASRARPHALFGFCCSSMLKLGSYVTRLRRKRAERADQLFRALARYSSSHDHLAVTGELFPRGNLKSRQVQEQLRFLADFSGRFFTRRVCVRAVLLLLTELQIQPPRQETAEEWSKRQASRLQLLAKRTKALARARSHAMALDDMETLPFARLSKLALAHCMLAHARD